MSHAYFPPRLQQWLTELVGSNRGDPILQLHWAPSLSMVETTASISLSSEGIRSAECMCTCTRTLVFAIALLLGCLCLQIVQYITIGAALA